MEEAADFNPSGFRVSSGKKGFGCRILKGSGFRVQGFGFRVWNKVLLLRGHKNDVVCSWFSFLRYRVSDCPCPAESLETRERRVEDRTHLDTGPLNPKP